MERERDVEAWLRREIEKKLKGVLYKFVSPGQDGVPDRLCVLPDGRVIFVELKTEDGELSRIQRFQVARLVELKREVCVVYGLRGAARFFEDLQAGETPTRVYRADAEPFDIV